MAKGSSDVILRDRLQFDINQDGDTALVYGRIDLSDYVSIVENKGLAIKEVRFMLRAPGASLGSWPTVMLEDRVAGSFSSRVKIFATTTAYENVTDVGIASPNVLCVMEKETSLYINDPTVAPADVQANLVCTDEWYGTPDLHPEGYDVVTDLLIGISLSNCDIQTLADSTAELDVMLIAEPKKITQKDMTQMLSQAQDL
ncbi:MAG: hypothetical protein GY845_26035 [Planctomycetes bacterium]|nr:hypothetical protein [Planctomycetota bacterium]